MYLPLPLSLRKEIQERFSQDVTLERIMSGISGCVPISVIIQCDFVKTLSLILVAITIGKFLTKLLHAGISSQGKTVAMHAEEFETLQTIVTKMMHCQWIRLYMSYRWRIPVQ